MTRDVALSLAAMVGASTTISTVVVDVFGISLVLLLWTAVGSLVAIAVAQEMSRTQAITRFGLGIAVGSAATPFAINMLDFVGQSWSHKFIAAVCGALTLLAIQLAIEYLPKIVQGAIETVKAWAIKRWGG